MLSAKLKSRLLSIARSIESDKEKFISLVKEVAIEVGGPNWSTRILFPCGEMLRKNVAQSWLLRGECGTTPSAFLLVQRKSLVFGVPFEFALKVPIENIARVKEIMDADKTDAAPEAKLRDAARQVREAKRQVLFVRPHTNPIINELRSLLSLHEIDEKLDRNPKVLCAVKSLVTKLNASQG